MSITRSVPLKSYSSMNFFLRKIRIIFDIENWLWKSEFCHFWQLLLNWVQDLKTFKGLVLGLNECLVESATVCVKSEDIITWVCGKIIKSLVSSRISCKSIQLNKRGGVFFHGSVQECIVIIIDSSKSLHNGFKYILKSQSNFLIFSGL